VKKSVVSALFWGFALASCASKPSPTEEQTMQNAPMPSSEQAAQQAVSNYFNDSLFDGPTARYQFLPLTHGYLKSVFLPDDSVLTTRSYFGWFMCGHVNGKNRYGAYTGYKLFIVHFSPTQPNSVDVGIIGDEAKNLSTILGWCNGVYGRDISAANERS
jgi:hypothetical protein